MQPRLRIWCYRLLTVGILLASLGWGAAYVQSSFITSETVPTPPVQGIQFLADGFKVRNVARFNEEVTALSVSRLNVPALANLVFVGTSPKGSVYRLDPASSLRVKECITENMGDLVNNGTCNVNALAVKDLDGDGSPDLLASTSQILPRGRPRLYFWGLGYPTTIREISRPAIESSWSHGLGFLTNPADNSTSAFITFCGFGEIVEYRFEKPTSSTGFAHETLGWKQVGKLPASGEWLQTADADNDGEADLCISTGYAEDKAAIMIFGRDAKGALKLKHTINEGARFGNVHFVVGDATGNGLNDVVAWWCSEIDGGDCEMIRYKVSATGAIERSSMLVSLADEIMPRDGQMVFHDLDHDGRLELWFASRNGSLWRYDPARNDSVQRVLKLEAGMGPITTLDHTYSADHTGIYVGSGQDLIQVMATH